MKLRLHPQLVEKIPGIVVAALVIQNINNARKNSTVAQLLRGVCEEKKRELKNEKKLANVTSALEHISCDGQVLSEGYLLESMLKKALKGTEIKSENNLLDVAHYVGLKYLTPVFGRDLDEVDRDLEVAFFTPQKKKKAPDMDYSRDTKNMVLWLVDIGTHNKEGFMALPETFTKLIHKYCGGKIADVYWLNAENPEADLGYVSEKEMAALAEGPLPKPHPAQTGDDSVPAFLQPTASTLKAELLLKDQLHAEVMKTVESLTAQLGVADKKILEDLRLEQPREKNHGDYATSIALKLGKLLGQNPKEVAEIIQKTLPKLPYLERSEIAGPGFINFYLSTEYLQQELKKILQLKQHFGKIGLGFGKKVLVEYSAPNIAKPLGVHHLLSTIIGQTMADIMRAAGYETVSLNYPGDWGTQFGKLLYAYKQWGDEAVVKKDPLNELLKLYVQFHNEVEKDPALEDKGREEFKKLEEGDPENMSLWSWIRELSIREVERIYKKLGVHFDEYLGEKMYVEAAKALIEEGKQKGIFVEGERGALIVPFEGEKYPPYMVQKADGTTLYSSRDIASIRDRIARFKPDMLVYVVDIAQSLHFKQLFETARKFGMDRVEDKATPIDFVHLAFGRMQLPEGRMSTRKGEVVLLDEVIKEAVARSEKIIAEKSHDLDAAEKQRVAEAMAVSALKYNIICQNPETTMIFDWDRMLALDGNSAPYLEYSYARGQSILRKVQEMQGGKSAKKSPGASEKQTSLFTLEEDQKAASEADVKPFEHPMEQQLLHLLVKFPEAVEAAAKTYRPNLITNYLYELAQTFNGFYNEVSVLHTAREDLQAARLDLVKASTQVLKNGMKMLGVTVFEKM